MKIERFGKRTAALILAAALSAVQTVPAAAEDGWAIDQGRQVYRIGDANATGWLYLEIPLSWQEQDPSTAEYAGDHNGMAWFYFSPMTGRMKKDDVTEIDGVTYGFHRNGMLLTGWVREKAAVPERRGYAYYGTGDETGIRTARMWRYLRDPEGSSSGARSWFYFDAAGFPLAASPDQGILSRTIDGRIYLFDSDAHALSGMVEVVGGGDPAFYYLDPAQGLAASVGSVQIDDGNGAEWYMFDESGRGVTGEVDGYLYYRGRLQRKSRDFGIFEVDGRKKLVDPDGRIVKGMTVENGNTTWTTGVDGEILSAVIGGNSVNVDSLAADEMISPKVSRTIRQESR